MRNAVCIFVVLVFCNYHFYCASHNSELVYTQEAQVPLKYALTDLSQQSKKRLLFDSTIDGTVSYAFNGVYWREALQLLFQVNQLTMEETSESIYVYKKSKNLRPRDMKLEPKDAKNLLDVSDKNNRYESLSLAERIKISGISGNENSLLAIVNFDGENQIWSVGKSIDSKYIISDIKSNYITLKNESSGIEEKVTF